MAALKQFNSQDIIVSPFEVNKGFNFDGDAELTSSEISIERYLGKNGNYLIDKDETGDNYPISEVLVYNNIKQLYYTNYISGSDGQISNATTASFNTDGTIDGPIYQTSFFNYEVTDLNPQKSFPTGSNAEIGVISIPSKLYGDYIQPKSIRLVSSNGTTIFDDGEGRILSNNEYVGNISYNHGLIILTKEDSVISSAYGTAVYGKATYGATINSTSIYGTARYGLDRYGVNFDQASAFLEDFITNPISIEFSSSYEIFETQYKCTIGSDEFNYSQNPSTLSGSKGEVYPEFTKEYFNPYITTIGLYNEKQELLAVGKLAKPLPTSRTTDTTILINLDR